MSRDKLQNAVICIRLAPDDKAALVAAARDERRSLSSFMVAAGLRAAGSQAGTFTWRPGRRGFAAWRKKR